MQRSWRNEDETFVFILQVAVLSAKSSTFAFARATAYAAACCQCVRLIKWRGGRAASSDWGLSSPLTKRIPARDGNIAVMLRQDLLRAVAAVAVVLGIAANLHTGNWEILDDCDCSNGLKRKGATWFREFREVLSCCYFE